MNGMARRPDIYLLSATTPIRLCSRLSRRDYALLYTQSVAVCERSQQIVAQ